ncbi:MAG: cytochrome c maturation protein CcmE [Bacteroidota bacterium]
MKKIYIVVLGMAFMAVALLLTASDDVSTYSSFAEAMNTDKKVKIVGKLAKDKPIEYDPAIDPNYTGFYLRDSEGVERKVALIKAKPQDFERSEQIVLTGTMEGDEFVATEILMKCPSKYKDEEIFLKEKEASLGMN